MNEIKLGNIYEKLNNNPNADPNDNYDIIYEEITYAKTKHMPNKLVTFNRYKHKKSAWITQGLITSIRYRDKMYTTFKLTNPNSGSSSLSSCCRSRSDKDCFHHLTLALHLSLCCESDVHESIFMSLSLRLLLMVSLNRRRGHPLFL